MSHFDRVVNTPLGMYSLATKNTFEQQKKVLLTRAFPIDFKLAEIVFGIKK